MRFSKTTVGVWDLNGVLTIDALANRMDAETEGLLRRSRGLLQTMHADDREEAANLHEKIQAAVDACDSAALRNASKALRELLFFVEGQAS